MVCIYHYFIIEYTHISYSITQRRIIDACFTESDFTLNKRDLHGTVCIYHSFIIGYTHIPYTLKSDTRVSVVSMLTQ